MSEEGSVTSGVNQDDRSSDAATNAPLITVGIGASAGGLEALKPFVRNLPVQSNMAYIVAQHVSPQHKSMMVELLTRSTELQVVSAHSGMVIEKNLIYITPPSTDVSVSKGRIVLSEPHSTIGAKPSIDFLFQSLSQEMGEHAVGVILSGTGSDGTQGARAIMAGGGIVIVQHPEDAKYESMPRSAMRAEVVDLVLTSPEIARQLKKIASMPRDRMSGLETGQSSLLLEELLNQIFKSTGYDFKNYKEATLSRQVARRITALQMTDPAEYLKFATDNDKELSELQKSFLISVTAFSRDPDAWVELRKILEKIIRGKQPRDRIRIWVPGCATGEEVYSIAYEMAEILGARLGLYNIKVFGTDIDQNAAEVARRGFYPAAALANLEQNVVENYFDPEGDGYKVKKHIREMVMFARHDLVQDPPFLKMDLISCRNVLIYLKQSFQDRLFSVFHYALNKEGYLFLGKSESVTQGNKLFEPVHNKHKLYRRGSGDGKRVLPISQADIPAPKVFKSKSGRRPDREFVRRKLGDVYLPPSMLINDRLEPVHLVGDIRRYLNFPDGPADFTVTSLLGIEVRSEVRALLQQCFRTKSEVVGHPITLQIDGEVERVRPVLRYVDIEDLSEPGVLMTLEPVSGSRLLDGEAEAEALDAASRNELNDLRRELEGTREHMQALVEELETSNEELESLNEELQASSEELQSSNEELETINEELQASNEELATANEELEAKSSEIVEMNDALLNIQNSVNMAILVVDPKLKVLRYTPMAVKIFGVMDSDIGQPLTTLPCYLNIEGLERKIHSVVKTQKIHVEETLKKDSTHLMQISPYLDHMGRCSGAVLTFSDVTAIVAARTEKQLKDRHFKLITESLREVIWLMDPDEQSLAYISPSFESLWGLSRHEVTQDPSQMLDVVHEDDRNALISRRELAVNDQWTINYRLAPVDKSIKWLREQGSVVRDERGAVQYLVVSVADVSKLVTAEANSGERQDPG